MIPGTFSAHLENRIAAMQSEGIVNREHVLQSAQGSQILLSSGKRAINLCANNYLGLANHPDAIRAGKEALEKWGAGVASVRFICGTQEIHKQLESRLAAFLGKDDALLYSSCFDANGGLFEALLGEEDAVISDARNHASSVDGLRLCKAKNLRYANGDLKDLEKCLEEAKSARFRLISTDGIFSVDGIVAPLKGVCELAEKYDALVMVDDSHGAGILGPNGRGTPELCGVADRVDILTGTLGKALGGASGGYIAGNKQIVEWLRRRSRPYLYSNAVAPVIAAISLAAVEIAAKSVELRARLHANAALFRNGLKSAGFDVSSSEQHPIVTLRIENDTVAKSMADRLLEEGVYVMAFSHPVVPKGQARIRTQMSAIHQREELETALLAFQKAGRELGLIP